MNVLKSPLAEWAKSAPIGAKAFYDPSEDEVAARRLYKAGKVMLFQRMSGPPRERETLYIAVRLGTDTITHLERIGRMAWAKAIMARHRAKRRAAR
jgi:hypothetical protein